MLKLLGLLIQKIINLFTEEPKINLELESMPWEIIHIENGLKCHHESGLYEDLYMEADEIDGENAFSEFQAITPIQLFNKLKSVTPKTKGFIYKKWNIIDKEGRGFLIKPRLKGSNIDIQERKDMSDLERYKTNESLNRCDMSDFILYLERGTDYGAY